MDPRTPIDAEAAADLRADDPGLKSVAPGSDDSAARRARAAIEARLFGAMFDAAAVDEPAPGPVPAADADAPTQVGRYVLESRIGAGGMGVVYRAHDPELDRHVAVKLLRAAIAAHQDERARLRMIREARAMARLAHPNVIHVYDVGAVEDQVFVAMELVDGPSLARWLGGGARAWQEVLDRFLAAGEGLAAAHRAGLIHRDFKPENVLVGEDGRVRVLDFGLARTASGARPGPRRARPARPRWSPARSSDTSAGAGAGPQRLTLTRTGALLQDPTPHVPRAMSRRTGGRALRPASPSASPSTRALRADALPRRHRRRVPQA
ncbi:MAG: serine/threonine-protein kinase [Nannocystaceae bacterium]